MAHLTSGSFNGYMNCKSFFEKSCIITLSIRQISRIKVVGLRSSRKSSWHNIDTVLHPSNRLAMINQNRENFQYRGVDVVYIISPLTSQLRTNSQKIAVKYVGPIVIYKIIDPHNYLLMTLDGVMLKGIFEHKRLKPTVIRTNWVMFII